MSSTAVTLFFALLPLASAAPATSSPDSGTHRLQKRLETGSKIAIGICVPCVALVLGLGMGILWFYPEQRRKLKARNARREAFLAERERRGSGHTTLPAYKEHEGSDHELDDVTYRTAPTAPTAPAPSAAPARLGRRYEAQPSTDARHAALTV
ncbi:hypothetical protein E8E11_001133 [Didymella keratinophila]|nr:hypothetical protein E8E11_001133 [Didymella keratinophila]